MVLPVRAKAGLCERLVAASEYVYSRERMGILERVKGRREVREQ